MKKLLIGFVVIVFAFACESGNITPTKMEDDLPSKYNSKGNRSISGSGARTASIENTDWSGLVRVKLFYNEGTAQAEHNNASVQVDADYVLIGGSAWVTDTESGAFLTESRPDFNGNSWVASSKDHQNVDLHSLHVVAIGLRLVGVTSDVLRSYIRVTSLPSSGPVSSPSKSITIQLDEILLGGGVKVNVPPGGSNLLVYSFPNGTNSWTAKSKDHLVSSPATLDVYAIAIKNVDIPGFGFLESGISIAGPQIGSGTQVAGSTIPTGWITSCPGGQATFSGYGRMIMDMKVTSSDPFAFSTRSKDHKRVDSGSTYAYAVRIRKKP